MIKESQINPPFRRRPESICLISLDPGIRRDDEKRINRRFHHSARGRGRQQGFSLLEVLVAFSILAISLGLLLQSFSTSLRGVALSERYTKATSLAESLLQESGISHPLRNGELGGNEAEGLYRWRLSMQQYDPEAGGSEGSKVIPFTVQATVGWQEGDRWRDVTLTTLKLKAAEE